MKKFLDLFARTKGFLFMGLANGLLVYSADFYAAKLLGSYLIAFSLWTIYQNDLK